MSFHVLLIVVFVLAKALQAFLYPDPYMIGDTDELVRSALSGHANPYKPMGYSAFIALVRPIAPTPLALVLIHGGLRLLAVLMLTRVLSREFALRRRFLAPLAFVLALDPQSLFLDHFILSDSLFITLSLASLAAVLAYWARPGGARLAIAVAVVAVTVPVRFVGIGYPVLLAGVAIARGPHLAARVLHTLVALCAGAAVGLGLSWHMKRSLDVFAPTTFSGWAIYGNLAPLLDDADWPLPEGADPELALLHAYFTGVPDSVYAEPNTNWHRWHGESPAKTLHGIFIAKPPEDDVTWRRNREFLSGFIELSQRPRTRAQRLFNRYRDPEFAVPYAMNHRQAFIVTNALLERLCSAFLRDHLPLYVSGFFAESLRNVFLPVQEPLAHGRYTHRAHPDASITQLWPGEHTPTWQPRGADVAASFRWVHACMVPLYWLVAFGAVGRFAWRRGARVLAEPGPLLVAFAILYGAAVAWGHMVEIRYTAPILPFALVGAALALGEVTRSTVDRDQRARRRLQEVASVQEPQLHEERVAHDVPTGT